MGRIEEIVELPAPPDRVWAVAADPACFGEWLTMHRAWQGEAPTTIAVGDRVTALVRVAELRLSITWTVEDYTAPHRIRLGGRAPAGVEVALAFDIAAAERSGASTVAISVRFDGPLLAGPIGAAVERAARDEVRASAAKLRELLA